MTITTRILLLILVLAALAASSVSSSPGSTSQRRTERPHHQCTASGLSALKSIPKLSYGCGQDPDEDIQKSPRRRVALKAYLTRLEVAAGSSFWAASVDDLNACGVAKKVRPLTAAEQRELHAYTTIWGDEATRLIVLPDPCVKYSDSTNNAFVLQLVGGRAYATQVLDAFYSRLDPGVELQLAHQNGETVVVVQTNSEPMMTTLFSTYHVYSIDPGTHRAVPRKLFIKGRKLTNEFEFDQYLFDDEETMRRWHAPELIRNGKLSPRFDVYTMKQDQDQAGDAGAKFTRKTYVWNGRYYAPK